MAATTSGSGQRQPSSGLAITSMVLGIVGLVLCWFIYIGLPAALLGVILGFIALNKVKAGTGGGRGMAVTGIVCGFIAIGLVVVVFVGFLAILGFGAKAIEQEMEKQKQQMDQQGAILEPLLFYARTWIA